MTQELLCISLFVLLCIGSIHCDSFYINAAANGSSTDCSKATPCQSFSQVIKIFPEATAYDLNVAPGVYNSSSNAGLVFTVPVSIQPYSSGQNGAVIIDAGTFEGAVINATNSVAIKGITMLADATTLVKTTLLAVDSLQPLTLQQVNLTTAGSGIGMQVYNAENITISRSFVTSASINITGVSIMISNTVFANTAYPAIALYNVPTVVIDSSQFNQAEVVTSYCDEIILSNSVFNSPSNTLNNSASFLSDNGQNIYVSNVSMVVTEASSYSKYGLRFPTFKGNLTIDSFQLSGQYSEGIVANGTSATISNVNISGTTVSAMVVQVDYFNLSQFYLSNCTCGVNFLGQATSAVVKMNEGIVSNSFVFGTEGPEDTLSSGEISNVHIQVTGILKYSTTSYTPMISLTSGSWLLSNLTATSTVATPFYCIIYGGSPSAKRLTLEARGVNFSGFTLVNSAFNFFDTPGLNLTITDSTFSNISLFDIGFSIINVISAKRSVIFIDNCKFNDSVIAAIATVKSTSVDIRNSVFSNVSLPKNPVLYSTVTINSAASVSVSNNSFIGNSFSNGALGVLFSEATVISNCTFSNNLGGNSGGLFTNQAVGFNVSGCSFTNNTVLESRGIITGNLNEPTLGTKVVTSIIDSTFTGNHGYGVYLSKPVTKDSYIVSVGDLIFNNQTEYAIVCENGITIEYQGDVIVNGRKDSKDDIYGCTITNFFESILNMNGPLKVN